MIKPGRPRFIGRCLSGFSHRMIVSPDSRQQRYAGWDKWEWPFVQWAEREGIALDYATNEDLERYPDLLSSYRLVVSVGHDEYWSVGMRDAFESYIHKGGECRVLQRQRLLSTGPIGFDGIQNGFNGWEGRRGIVESPS